MTEENDLLIEEQDSECNYCPICGEKVEDTSKRHICPEHILDKICKEEEAKSDEFDDDDAKTYGERLDDAEFILNYYNEEYDEDEDEY